MITWSFGPEAGTVPPVIDLGCSVKRVRTFAVLFAGFAVLGAWPAQAARPVQMPPPGAELAYMLHQGQDEGPVLREATLTCNPDGGTHRDPAAACAALIRARGELWKVEGDPDRVCTKEFAPVTVHVKGHWYGKPINHTTYYNNLCESQSRPTDNF
jgi:hypothetical protein